MTYQPQYQAANTPQLRFLTDTQDRSNNLKVVYLGAPEFTKENLPQQEDVIYQFQKLIQERYADDRLDLETIARELMLSQIQLYRKVKQFVNQGPISYLKAYRLQKAIELLANTNALNISEIAYRVGFTDPNYFSRVFSSKFGQTPSAYRKKTQQTYWK